MMMLAAMMGAVAFQKGLGVTHSCAHALSSVCNTHHGLANGVMLPFAMAFNAERAPARFAAIAQALKLQRLDGNGVVDWMRDLQKAINIAPNLSAIGVKRDHISDLADFAIKDGCHLSNPVPVTRSDFVHIFEAAL
jgi:alcohol dehydrogenase class IV